MKMAKLYGQAEEEERLQSDIFGIEHDMDETNKLLMEGDLRRFKLQEQAMNIKWQREEAEKKK